MLYVIVNICGVSNNLINEYEMKWKKMKMQEHDYNYIRLVC